MTLVAAGMGSHTDSQSCRDRMWSMRNSPGKQKPDIQGSKFIMQKETLRNQTNGFGKKKKVQEWNKSGVPNVK